MSRLVRYRKVPWESLDNKVVNYLASIANIYEENYNVLHIALY